MSAVECLPLTRPYAGPRDAAPDTLRRVAGLVRAVGCALGLGCEARGRSSTQARARHRPSRGLSYVSVPRSSCHRVRILTQLLPCTGSRAFPEKMGGHSRVRAVEKRQRELVNAPRPGGKAVACFASEDAVLFSWHRRRAQPAMRRRRQHLLRKFCTKTRSQASPSACMPVPPVRNSFAPSPIASDNDFGRPAQPQNARRDVGRLRLLNADTAITRDRPIEGALSTPWHRFATPATISTTYQCSR